MLEIQLAGTYEMPMHTMKFPDTLFVPGKTKAKSSLNAFVPQAFISYKLNKFAFGVGHYTVYEGSKVDWKKEDIIFDYRQSSGIMAFAPTFSYMINEKLGIGARAEIFYGRFESEMDFLFVIGKEKGSGWSFTGGGGIIYKPLDILTLGLSGRGPFKLKPSGTVETQWQFGDTVYTDKYDIKGEIDFPISINLGIGLKPIPNFTAGFDFEYTTWSSLDYIIVTRKTEEGEGRDSMPLHFENTFKIKLGFEYTLPVGLSLRTGFAYDKAASPDSTLWFANIDVDKFVLYGGFGYEIANFGIDLAILKAFGSEREGKAEGEPTGIKYNMNPMVIGVALRYKL
ncbi:MAG: outer membrane protein transport protein [Candidatus Hydrothermales bacterium]